MIFLLEKIKTSTFLQMGAWNLYFKVLCYNEFDDVIVNNSLAFLGCFQPFLKISQILSGLWLLMGNIKLNGFFFNQHKQPILLIYFCYQNSDF